MNSGAPVSPPNGCEDVYRAVVTKAVAKFKPGSLNDGVKVKGSFGMPGPTLDPTSAAVSFAFGRTGGVVYEAEVPVQAVSSRTRRALPSRSPTRRSRSRTGSRK